MDDLKEKITRTHFPESTLALFVSGKFVIAPVVSECKDLTFG